MSRLAAALQDLRSLEALASRATALAQRDPRAKLLVTLCFVVTVVSFERYRVAALLPLALFPTVLAAQGELPRRTLWRALGLAAPFALMVALANPLLDRAPLLTLAGLEIGGGWVSGLSILLRFALCASAATVLIGTTGVHALCAALARLGAPAAFTVQLLFLHRYVFVLAGEALRLSQAHRLRARPGSRMGLATFAALTGQLLLRALARAQRVHQAMLARGFDGRLRLADPWRWQGADTRFVAAWCAFFLVARAVDLPAALGRLITGAVT